MDKIELLKQEFQNAKIEFGKDILKNISTKTDDEILFPPYIPFVGKNYQEFKILVYSTAQNIKFDSFRNSYQQNISKLTERLYYFDNFKKKYPDTKMSYQNIAINPYQTGVVAALLGVFIYAKFNKKIKNLDEINELISISNYYKFSLNNGNNDINPEPTGKNKINDYIKDKDQINNYWSINDNLVKREIDTLEPKFILSFKGRKLKELKQISKNKFKVIEINDPSWILNGGGGHLSKNGSWWKKAMNCKETEINELINHYLSFITGNYKGKKEGVRIYLLNYYSDWKIRNNAR
ncbi:hypothetical protein [Ancylomarina sp. 16SWW S1-10-2]|uniref:hypothetical protein n=1 Tax=Ancylomarina sp. 16SWW S1-10-2 TaxID=2499681 RepID=UPI0012AD5825|nr:hypothetical protein [Ancylomarina sp. 16SWW S1-10-2]MRT93638.1 hypothetical protein [Ancylomarina sp. 16SWW S1-10-2]